MSFLKDKIGTVSNSETVHLDTLDVDVEIRKITMKDAKRLEKLKDDDPLQATLVILSRFVFVDGKPIADEDDLETIGDMTAEMINEIADKFARVNGSDIEDLKKKVEN